MRTPDNLVKIPVEQLLKGMCVVPPTERLDRPPIHSQFIIKSDKDIQRLKSYGFPELQIDIERSTLPPGWTHTLVDVDEMVHIDNDHPTVKPKTIGKIPEQWNASNLIPDQLKNAIFSPNMQSAERSDAVYRHSSEMMRRLLESPSTENIKESKKTIRAIADLILSDDKTAGNLLRITSHDFYTYTHSVNVGVTAIILAKALFKGSGTHNIPELGAGFFLHDIGKVKVRAEVINKPGRLNDSEMRHIQIHPYQGYKLLKQADELTEECRYIVMQHHERTDGSGYPKKLTGDQIHIYGKICCIADVFDALTADRSYRKAISTIEALKLMKNQMMGHFDRKFFATFVNLYL